MWKSFVFCTLFAATLAGVIHDFEDHHAESYHHHEPVEAETDHHHKVEHEHATSHQSFKIHHFHPVPVYVKKEDQHFLKHPVEVSGVHHKLKILHPETEKHHGHGLVLENHTDEQNHHHIEHHDEGHHEPIHDFGHEDHHEHHDFGGGGGEEHHDFGGGGEESHHQFHDINVHHGHHHE